MLGKLITTALGIAISAGMARAAQPLRLASPISVHSLQTHPGIDANSTRLQIDGFGFDLSEAGQAVIIRDQCPAITNTTEIFCRIKTKAAYVTQ